MPLKAVGTRAHERVDRRSRDGTSAKREGPEAALPKLRRIKKAGKDYSRPIMFFLKNNLVRLLVFLV